MASLSDSFTPTVGRLRTFLTGQRNDPGTAPPEPSPATPAWTPMAPSGDPSRVTPTNPAGIKFAHGGRVRGPGTGTSDSIKARLSDGEYVLPTDTVAAMGGPDALDRVKDATHQPVRSLAGGFANGGAIDPLRPNSFGDAAAASNGAGVTQLSATPAPGGNAVPGMQTSEFHPPPAQSPLQAQAARAVPLPGGSNVPGMTASEIPAGPANPNVGAGGSAEAKAFQAGRAAPAAPTAPASPTIANSFGDAAAAAKTPGITQVETAAAKPGIVSRVGGGLVDGAKSLVSKPALAIGGAVGGIVGASESLADTSNGYRDKSQADLGVTSPLGSVAADAARTMSNVGNSLTGGYAEKVGRGLSSAVNGGSFLDGFSQDTDRAKFLDDKKQAAAVSAAPDAAVTPGEQMGPPSSANVPNRIGNSFDQGTTIPGDLPNNVREAMGINNGGVGVVGAAGVTSADTLGQANRDVAHMREMNALNKGSAGFSGVIGGGSIGGMSADDRQSFFDNANLRNAASKGSWSPRGGYKSDDSAIAAALAPITARNQRQIADSKNLADSTAARMTDATNRRDTDVRADATKYGADATYKAATMKNSFELQQRALSGQVFRAANGDPAKAATLAASIGLDSAPFTAMASAAQAREAGTQAVQEKAIGATREATQVFGPDGKADPAGSAAAHDVITKLFKGASTMNSQEREAALPAMKALADIYGKTAQGNQMGVAKWNPFDPKASPLDSMPNFKGGQLIRASTGALVTPGVSMGDYYVKRADGTQVPLGKISEKQLELINQNIKTGKWN